MSDIQAVIAENTPRYLDELKEFLRIPSISTMPEHAGDIHRAAEWLQGNFSAMGGTEVEIHETPKHPIVTARFGNDPSKPTVLVYGHYDVQPAGNPEEWTTPAFEPDVRNGMIYARGAVDDKGQVFAHLKALEFLQQQGGELPCNMLYVIEGEEEIGSPNLRGFVDAHKEMLACDAIVISDTAVLGEDLPAMTVGLRGATFIRVKVSGPTTELHSGLYGGAVTDPNIALAKMIAGMTDENNRITIPGFYDGIKEHSPEARAAINAQPHDDEAYKAKLGVDALTGENGFTPLERTGIRPSFTVHGIQSGPPVNTLKPVIAPFAEATMSLRLVSGQDPKGMGDRMGEYLASLAPKGVVVTHKMLLEASPWSKTSDAAADQVAADSFGRVWGKRPIPVYSGGAIPVVPVFEELLGASPVMMGFGLHEDGLHAPNEHFGISRLQKGIATLVDFFQNFPAAHAAGKAESRPVVQ
jgi:acetylornithine deacetylase/succinyl-diaminopimelate desuccinylase-like protein